ncbi:hypothetical protein BGX38DRAFT_2985 [Terfezia claveryi]|nr:hypothetical protein BGX38DRAFT_2985 [Terfezia claveryi]
MNMSNTQITDMPNRKHPTMANTTTPRPWTRGEVEKLISWMEENHEQLRGKQIAWHKEVKEQSFALEEHITVKKISEKIGNMKKAWKGARAMQIRSGWGVRYEDNEQSINELLERRCPFFWRLEELWGSRPNISVILHTESIASPIPAPSQPVSQRPSEPVPQILFEPVPASEPASESSSRRGSPALHATPAPLLPPKRSGKRDLNGVLKRAFEEKQAAQLELSLKRIKAENEAKVEIARIQADAQVKQMEIFARMTRDMLAASRGGFGGGSGGFGGGSGGEFGGGSGGGDGSGDQS